MGENQKQDGPVTGDHASQRQGQKPGLPTSQPALVRPTRRPPSNRFWKNTKIFFEIILKQLFKLSCDSLKCCCICITIALLCILLNSCLLQFQLWTMRILLLVSLRFLKIKKLFMSVLDWLKTWEITDLSLLDLCSHFSVLNARCPRCQNDLRKHLNSSKKIMNRSP